jgi:hypothetical protein
MSTPGAAIAPAPATPALAPRSAVRAAADASSLRGGATPLGHVRAQLASRRGRFAIGVLLAVVLGFIPADIVATLREHSALRAIDARVVAAQDAADSQDSYAALDAFRAQQLALKRSKRRMIALTSLLVWAAASGAVGYVWFWRMRREHLDDARLSLARGPSARL